MGDKNFRWWSAYAEDADTWGGPYPSRAEAVAGGRLEYEGADFWICEADKSVCRPSFHSDWIAEQLIDDLAECNEECWGEDGHEGAWTKEAERALERALEKTVADWLAAHPAKTWAADEVRNWEHIPAAEPAS